MILPEEIDESLNVPWKDHGQGHQSVEQQGRSWRVNILKYKDDLRYSKKVGSLTWTNTEPTGSMFENYWLLEIYS